MTATIISIGNELLIGDTINTNASWIGRFLTEKGFKVVKVVTVTDDYHAIVQSVNEAIRETRLVITTGGLGPTHDDITKKAIADLFDSGMVLNEEVLTFIRESFKKRGIPFSRSNYDQALVPEKCQVIFNQRGTAPGLWFATDHSSVAVLPGVPHEMRHLMETGVLEQIEKTLSKRENNFITYIRTAGIGESSLSDDVLGNLEPWLNGDLQVAFLPGAEGVTIRISTFAEDQKQADQNINSLKEHIYRQASDYIFGEGRDISLSHVVGELLKERNQSLAVAESCTGGLLASNITDIPGSSTYFFGSVVAYSNALKQTLLGVRKSTLQNHGAVSGHTALEMAKGIRKATGSDVTVSTTGIAGPGGGSKDKPVGLVWMGFCFTDDAFALRVQLTQDRLINKQRTVSIVLDTVRRRLRNLDSFPYGLKAFRV